MALTAARLEIDRLFVLNDPDLTEDNVKIYLTTGGELSCIREYLDQYQIDYFDDKTVFALNLYHIVLQVVTDKSHPEVKKIQELFFKKIEERHRYAPCLLYYALLNDLYPLAKDFITHGFDINTQEAGVGATALYLTSLSNKSKTRYRAVQWLLQRGADQSIKRVDADEETAFHAACYHGDIFVIDLLFKNRAPIDQPTKKGQTPLHYAISHPEAAKYLLSKGANPNAQNHSKETPLHLVSPDDGIQSIRYLLDGGIDITLDDQDRRRALDDFFAVQTTRTDTALMSGVERELFIYLGQYTTDQTPTELLLWLVEQREIAIIKELLVRYLKEHIPPSWKSEFESENQKSHYLNKMIFDKNTGVIRRSALLEVLLQLKILEFVRK